MNKNRKCLNCKKLIPLSWFLWSSNSTKYRCTECGALMQWKSRRNIIGGMSAGIGIILFRVLESVIPSLGIRFFILMTFAILVAFLIPNQYEMVKEY